jgi:hypothetical protein
MPDIGFVRSEIERMRVQVGRQRREILQLQKAGISKARQAPQHRWESQERRRPLVRAGYAARPVACLLHNI